MAAKRKNSLLSPPPAQSSSSSDEDSSSDEEQAVVEPTPPRAKTPTRTEPDDDESDSDSGSESDPDPPNKTLNTPKKPSESEDSSDEEEDEEEEEEQKEVEKPKSPVKQPESKPDKKKLKLSDPVESPAKKSSSVPARIWSLEDEMALLRGLSEYHAKNGKVPPQKDYTSFLSAISGSIGFPVTEKQLFNKVRQMRYVYLQNRKKGSDVNFSNSHKKAVFEMCQRLFEGINKAPKKEVSPETDSDMGTESGGGAANGGVPNGHAADGGRATRSEQSYFYLTGLIKDVFSGEQCSGWLNTAEDAVARIGEATARDLEAKTKTMRIDELRLCERKEKLKAEVFSALADDMADDQ